MGEATEGQRIITRCTTFKLIEKKRHENRVRQVRNEMMKSLLP